MSWATKGRFPLGNHYYKDRNVALVTSTMTRLDGGGTPIAPRPGPRPRTSPGSPHQQLNQLAPPDLQEVLWSRMLSLPHVRAGRSVIALEDCRALHLDPSRARGPRQAFAPDGGTEFAHLHGVGDGSLHMHLPIDVVELAVRAKWAEQHPAVASGWAAPTTVMIYGPREAGEIDVIFGFVQLSHAFALGQD